MTHHEYAKRQRLVRPCSCHDLNFGGGCFNCGYDPEREKRRGDGLFKVNPHAYAVRWLETQYPPDAPKRYVAVFSPNHSNRDESTIPGFIAWASRADIARRIVRAENRKNRGGMNA